MQMRYGLSAMLSLVDDDTVALFQVFLFGYFGCSDKKFAQDCLVSVFSL
jgi:hypothetical protein